MLDASQQLKQPKAHLCSVNEEYVACSSMCEPTCTSPPNQPCPAGCGPPKCQCRSGFVRHGGRCITRNQCPASGLHTELGTSLSSEFGFRAHSITEPPQTCGRNEHFVTCSSMCEPTCQSEPNEACPLGCGPPKCECLPGFVRDQGRCIRRDQCPASGELYRLRTELFRNESSESCFRARSITEPPQMCGPNERFAACSSMCEPTCQSEPNEACALGCGAPKCECLPGFVRDQGRCIRRDQCPASEPPQTCGRNEHFVTCSSMCEPTCQSEPNEACPLGCGPPKCECLPGFVRDQGRCIRRDQCPASGEL
ncbi:unnamed protein product [Toxocara canis]|uniref:TIL domain-containing protein n=1 Tax=Toxocara canis TaxID=6265 RepID=A0A183UW11_TOXCA|nr:unnamed protein product [Toxocara canis]